MCSGVPAPAGPRASPAIPRSRSLKVSSPLGVRVNMMLPGETSQCATPAWCRWCSACETVIASPATCRSESGACDSRTWCSVTPRTYSITNTGQPSGSARTSRSSTRLGCWSRRESSSSSTKRRRHTRAFPSPRKGSLSATRRPVSSSRPQKTSACAPRPRQRSNRYPAACAPSAHPTASNGRSRSRSVITPSRPRIAPCPPPRLRSMTDPIPSARQHSRSAPRSVPSG
jgi:hypothetical protein